MTDVDLEQDTVDVLKENGPMDFGDLLVSLAEYRGEASASDLDKVLENGPFVKDDSGRFHLTGGLGN